MADCVFDNKASNESQWWHDAVIYQVYPRSFADGNNDGIGDFTGVLSRIDHFHSLGVDAVWFSPFYPSPQHDAGYDVADYFDINPEYGTLAQFDKVINELHQRGLKVIIDLVPNHTSDQHPWFQQALKADPGSPQRDRYIFQYSADGYPNNWGSMFGGRAWQRVDQITHRDIDKNWWYLHLFDRSQPDVNWNNQDVIDYFDRYLHFWLDRGVDGFRVDVAHGCAKEPGFPDDVIGPDRAAYTGPIENLNRGPYYDVEGVHDIIRHWRRVLDEYGPDRMMVAESWVRPASRLARYVRPDEMHQTFNFSYVQAPWEPDELRRVITQAIQANNEVGAKPTWVLSNHDVMRHASRFVEPPAPVPPGLSDDDRAALGLRRARGATLFMLSLPGSAYIYQGEELGLPEYIDMPHEARRDPSFFRSGGVLVGRDGCRVPLPWCSRHQTNYGFSNGHGTPGQPWLPQPDSWADYAASTQVDDPTSTINFYKKAISLRKKFRLGRGDIHWVTTVKDTPVPPTVLACVNQGITSVFNMSDEDWPTPRGCRVIIDSQMLSVNQTTTDANDGWAIPPGACAWIVSET